MKKLLLSGLIVCFCKYGAQSSKLPGPKVYVVTPSSHEGRSAPAPFYYHNWMRRMDPPKNVTTTTTQTPDLIFAEFESGNKMKSIRKLLEKERIVPTTTTTSIPIYVPDETNGVSQEISYGLPPPDVNKVEKSTTADMTDYFALYNNMYNIDTAPVYLPSSTPSTTTTSTTTQAPVTTAQVSNVQNIWHIIDSQKHDDYSGKWEEVVNNEQDETTAAPHDEENNDQGLIDDNFALPGFGTNPGNGAENESRTIRTKPNIRFPYVNLEPFQMKTQKKAISNSKKGNNMHTSLDNFYDIKNPVRGEAQDVVPMVRQSIDRYNPAQPYLPQPSFGSKSKQSSPSVPPLQAVSNLVPPPPPPPPRISDGNFPAPTSYESFPPYSPPQSNAPELPPSGPVIPQPPVDSDDSGPDSAPDSDGPPIDYSYRYKPPSPATQAFLPTLPPLTKPYRGYSYDKPQIMPEPPSEGGYSYDKPPAANSPQIDNKPDFQEYHYSKPTYTVPLHDSPPSYGPGPDLSYGHNYPELYLQYHHHHPTTTTTTETPRVNRFSYYYLGKKLYYLPLYFSVYFIVYVASLIIKAVLRHKIVYPNSWRPNTQTAAFFSKRSIDSYDFSNENLHEITGKVTHAIAEAGKKYFTHKKEK